MAAQEFEHEASLRGEIASLIDDKVQEVPMVLRDGVQIRAGYAVVPTVEVMGVIEDLLGEGVDSPLGDLAEWESTSAVFFSSGITPLGSTTRAMSSILSRLNEDGQLSIGFGVTDDSRFGSLYTVSAFESGSDFAANLRYPLVTAQTNTNQLGSIRSFISEVSGIIPLRPEQP